MFSEESKPFYIVFIDFYKAYNTVCRKFLIEKLRARASSYEEGQLVELMVQLLQTNVTWYGQSSITENQGVP
jgi:hypothetical protein